MPHYKYAPDEKDTIVAIGGRHHQQVCNNKVFCLLFVCSAPETEYYRKDRFFLCSVLDEYIPPPKKGK